MKFNGDVEGEGWKFAYNITNLSIILYENMKIEKITAAT